MFCPLFWELFALVAPEIFFMCGNLSYSQSANRFRPIAGAGDVDKFSDTTPEPNFRPNKNDMDILRRTIEYVAWGWVGLGAPTAR